MSEKPKKTEVLEKRFGIIAIEKGYITTEEFIEAMKIQVLEDIQGGKHRLIGEILLGLNQMSITQVEDVLLSLFRKTS